MTRAEFERESLQKLEVESLVRQWPKPESIGGFEVLFDIDLGDNPAVFVYLHPNGMRRPTEFEVDELVRLKDGLEQEIHRLIPERFAFVSFAQRMSTPA